MLMRRRANERFFFCYAIWRLFFIVSAACVVVAIAISTAVAIAIFVEVFYAIEDGCRVLYFPLLVQYVEHPHLLFDRIVLSDDKYIDIGVLRQNKRVGHQTE